MLCVLFVSVRAQSNVLSATISVDPVTVTLGNSVHITGTVTNEGSRALTLFRVRIYAYQQSCASSDLIVADNVAIDAGQTISFATDYIPPAPCVGDWDAVITVQPKAKVSLNNFLAVEAEFAVL